MEETTNNEALIPLKREEVIKQANEIRQKVNKYNTQLRNLLNYPILEESTHSINFDFYLSNKAGQRVRSVFCQNKKFIYYTYLSEIKCNVPISIKKVFSEAKVYFDKYVKEYKNYKIQREPITNSTFRMNINYNTIPNIALQPKILYEIDIDNAKNNEIINEYKNNFLIEESKDNLCSFFLSIEIELYNHNKFFQYDGEKDPAIEDVCIVCHKNKPTILITKCFHLVICSECYRSKISYSCPRCNKKFEPKHLIRFKTSSKF